MNMNRSDSTVFPASLTRKIIAANMGKSNIEIPMVTLFSEVDAQVLVEKRNELKAKNIPVTYTDFLIKSAALALEKFSFCNSTWEEEKIIKYNQVNVGLAIDTAEGLIVPVIKDTNKKSLIELADIRINLIEKVKKRKLSLDDLSGGTFTLSNLGQLPIRYFTPIIKPQEGGILGVGQFFQSPVVINGDIMVRWRVGLSYTFDHRVVDGAPAGRFLQFIKECIEGSNELLFERRTHSEKG